MKNGWYQFFRGSVLIKITGKYAERFLNRCLEEDLFIWNVKQEEPGVITCYIHLRDVKKIRTLVRRTTCKVTFLKRSGLPFLQKRMKKRRGIVAGLFAFIALLFVFSNMIWNVEIKGASPKIEFELEKVVQEMGIKRGAFQFLLPKVEFIQRDVTEMIAGATWIGVRQKGTTYEFEVVEQQLPEEAERLSPRNLISTKRAIIHDVFVEQGQALVRPNDYVREGQVLVSGRIGKEEKEEIVPAKAKVLGEIWYKSHISIPLERLFMSLTGERVSRHYLVAENIRLPIWGFKRNDFTQSKQYTHEKPIRLFMWNLPIAYSRIDHYEIEQWEQEKSKKEIVAIARERARDDLKKHLPDGAEIIGEKVLHEALDSGKVKLHIHYKVIEDITSEQPIVQGE